MSNIGNKEVFAKNLRFYLKKEGRTQRELCEAIGVSKSTLNDWVMAKKYPRIDKIELLAHYFRVLKSDLIEDAEEHRQMHEKNDTITDAVLRMNADIEFLSVVELLLTVDHDKLTGVKQLLIAFQK